MAQTHTLPAVARRPLVKRLLWTGLYAGVGAAFSMAARRVAARLWLHTTGEEPPTKR